MSGYCSWFRNRWDTVALGRYLSELEEKYVPDEWELPRSKLTMEEEIGRGTFGKVSCIFIMIICIFTK